VNLGDEIIAWSIRLAMLLFVVVQAVQFQRPLRSGIDSALRTLWTISFLLFLVHVMAAFHFVHHWSHMAAYEATSEETRHNLGFAYGAGVYFNYLFLLVWAIDVYWMWRPAKHPNDAVRALQLAGRLYLLFIAFNGVVVFKSGWMRVLGAIATALLLGLAWRDRKKRDG
jgi:hypothetical protein